MAAKKFDLPKDKERKNKGFKDIEELTSLWPCIAEKWRGELRTPKVEYFASRGLHSKSA
jgi:hypothetical protein